MNEPLEAAAPETGIPKYADLLADPEIAALLHFEPVVRKTKRSDGWSPGLQRELIARIAHCGTPGAAADQMDKNPTGAKKLYPGGTHSFRAAWDGAIALAEDRERARRESGPARPTVVPGMPNRPMGPQLHGRNRGRPGPWSAPLAPGQVYNELGDPEDEASLIRRGQEARDNIGDKLLACRRAYLLEISRNPGKRAAFELLTELPIDWDKARRHQPQDHEPWRRPNFREGDMVVTAENGWLGSIVPAYGPDKIGKLREGVNRARKKRGLPPITDWSEDSESDSAERNPNDGACPVGLDGTSHPNADASGYAESREASPDGGARDLSRANPSDESCGFTPHDQTATPSDDETGFRPNTAAQPDAPNMRSFDLNSKEFYDTVKQPHQGILPRQPTEWAREPVPKIGPAPRVGPAGSRRR